MAPTRAAADQLYDERVARIAKDDANDSLWAIESIEDYSPEPDLPKIKAKVLVINTVEDEANPPELGTVEARDEEDSRWPLRADPVQRPDARAFHPLLRRGVEALSDQLYGIARPECPRDS
jgi:hypothetical protein